LGDTLSAICQMPFKGTTDRPSAAQATELNKHNPASIRIIIN